MAVEIWAGSKTEALESEQNGQRGLKKKEQGAD
jgi:hypothetical protein